MSPQESDVVPPSQFYGPHHTRNRLIGSSHRIKHRSRILKVIRENPELILRVFATQKEAFHFVDRYPQYALHVFCYEKDTHGGRQYIATTYKGFWRRYRRWLRMECRLHFYEVIREGTPTKLYFDLEFKKKFNCNKDGEKMIKNLIENVERKSGIKAENTIVELDSTTEKKFSRHLIFNTIVFSDNKQCGYFVEELVAEMIETNPTEMLVRDGFGNDDGYTTFVDRAVYSKNRCFRLIGSSKYGRDVRLIPPRSNSQSSHGRRVGIAEGVFLRSLVCNVPESTGLLDIHYGPSLVQTGGKVPRRSVALVSAEISPSRFPVIDDYITSLVNRDGGRIYKSVYFPASQIIVYTITGNYRYCDNIGRHHRSNNIMLCVDFIHKNVYQKCHDPDCRYFRSKAWPLPHGLLNDSRDDIFEGFSDEDLAKIMRDCELLCSEDCVDDDDSDDGEEEEFVSDEMLNKMYDDYERHLGKRDICNDQHCSSDSVETMLESANDPLLKIDLDVRSI